jgi:hypothetical protein
MVGAFGLFAIHEVQGVEAFDLGGKPHRKVGRVELGNRRSARLPRDEGLPRRRHIVAYRGDGPHASDDDPTLHYAPTFWFR